MQELEKILEEIEAEFDRRIDTQLKIMAGLNDDVYRYGYKKSLEAYQQGKLLVTEIIRKHMDDNWIPVEERLPEEDGFYLCTMDGKIVGEEEPFTGLSEFENGLWIDDDIDYRCIIAWQPLPEPYRPEDDKNA